VKRGEGAETGEGSVCLTGFRGLPLTGKTEHIRYDTIVCI